MPNSPESPDIYQYPSHPPPTSQKMEVGGERRVYCIRGNDVPGLQPRVLLWRQIFIHTVVFWWGILVQCCCDILNIKHQQVPNARWLSKLWGLIINVSNARWLAKFEPSILVLRNWLWHWEHWRERDSLLWPLCVWKKKINRLRLSFPWGPGWTYCSDSSTEVMGTSWIWVPCAPIPTLFPRSFCSALLLRVSTLALLLNFIHDNTQERF